MTEQNALRHFLSKAGKAKKRGNYEEMWKLYHSATLICDINCCSKCPHDDFGYCGLRRNKISEEDRFMEYCFDGFVSDMECTLRDKQKK